AGRPAAGAGGSGGDTGPAAGVAPGRPGRLGGRAAPALRARTGPRPAGVLRPLGRLPDAAPRDRARVALVRQRRRGPGGAAVVAQRPRGPPGHRRRVGPAAVGAAVAVGHRAGDAGEVLHVRVVPPGAPGRGGPLSPPARDQGRAVHAADAAGGGGGGAADRQGVVRAPRGTGGAAGGAHAGGRRAWWERGDLR